MKLVKYISGVMQLELKSDSLEYQINSISKEFDIENIKKTTENTIIFEIDLKAGRLLIANFQKKCYNIRVIKIYGLKVGFENLLKRWSLLVGFVVFLGLIVSYSMFIWDTDIRGENDGNIQAVEEYVQSLGLEGKVKNSISTSEIENNIIKNCDSVTFVNASMVGVKVVINVAFELDYTLEVASDKIIANVGGTVSSISVVSGTATVKVGDVISVGQTLIIGELYSGEGEDVISYKVPAVGVVYVTNDIEVEHEILHEQMLYVYTGNFVTIKEIDMLFYTTGNGSVPYDKYNVETRSYYAFKYSLLPIKIYETTYYELALTVVSSEFKEKESAYIANVRQELVQEISGDYEIINEFIEIENKINSDVIKMFLSISQKAS